MNKVGVVIPAYNEENDLHRVLNIVCSGDWLSQIIVVDDGSTDDTLAIAQKYAAIDSRMVVEHLAENRGKGAAMLAGLQAIRDDVEIVIFLDADLIGLSPANLTKLYEPVRTRQCDMAVAVFSQGDWRTDVSQWVFPNLGGQRALFRENAQGALAPLVDSGYGVEFGLTRYAKRHNWHVQHVEWEGTTHTMQEDSLGWRQGLKVRRLMYQDILATWIRIVLFPIRQFIEDFTWLDKLQRLLE